jgi:hypothetical protein
MGVRLVDGLVLMSDAPVLRAVECDVRGDGRSVVDAGERVTVAGRGHGGNSIARVDTHVNTRYTDRLSGEHGRDNGADRDRDGATGADTHSNADADPAMHRSGSDRPVPAMDGHTIEDAAANVHAEPDIGAMRHTGPLGSLSSVLLG